MRLLEMYQLRIKDIDFGLNQITVRAAKGDKDRIIVLPQKLLVPLQQQIQTATAINQTDRHLNRNGVYLPDALEKKYPFMQRNYHGFGYFPQQKNRLIRAQKSSAGIINTNKHYNAVLKKQCPYLASINPQHCIPCATASPHIYYKMGKTSAPYNPYWVIAVYKPP